VELRSALRHGTRLGPHDRLMVEALFQDWHGSGDSAQRMYRQAMVERPDDADAWFGYADVSFHQGPRSGVAFDATRSYFERALVLDSTSLATVVHLGRIAATQGDRARLRDLARRERTLRSPSAAPGELAWISAVANGEADTVTAMLAGLTGASDDVATDYAWRAATYGGDPAVAVRVLQQRADGDRPQTTRAATMLALAHFEAARARPRAAALWMERARALAPVPALLAEAGILWASTPSPDAVQAARFRLSRWRRSVGMGSALEELPTGGTLAFATSQLEMALQAAVGNDSLLARFVAICQHFDGAPVDDRLAADQVNAWGSARLLALRGDTTGAIALLEKTRVGMYPRGSIIFQGAVGRLERARLLLAQGKHEEALRWLASIHEENAHDAVLMPETLLLRTRALAALGDRAGARRSGQQLLRLWRDAEPTEHARLELVREAMRGEARVVASHASGVSGR
jgi:tetratricopeptide (TPR) repeat protein